MQYSRIKACVSRALIGKYALHDCEFSCIANLVPETAEEARTLHSTLKVRVPHPNWDTQDSQA